MNPGKPIQINIPHPCSQNWDEMKLAGDGRFCDHCQKTVIDFATWSDAELYKFFAKNNERVCGTCLPTQLDRTITIPHQPNSRLYRLTIALGLTLLVVNAPTLHGQNRAPLTAQTSTNKPGHKPGPAFGIIKGRVLDEQNQPKGNAYVQAIKDGAVVSDTTTDIDGNYFMELRDGGAYDIRVISLGCTATTTHKKITIGVNEIPPLIVEKQKLRILGEMVATPTTHIEDLASQGTGIYQQKQGKSDTVNKQKLKK